MDVSAVSSPTSPTPASATSSETGETGFAALLQGAFPRLSMTGQANAALEKAMARSTLASSSSRTTGPSNHPAQSQAASSWASAPASRSVQTSTISTSSDRASTSAPSRSMTTTSSADRTASTSNGGGTASSANSALSGPTAPAQDKPAGGGSHDDDAALLPGSGEDTPPGDAPLNDAVALAPATPPAAATVPAAPQTQGSAAGGAKPVQEHAPAVPSQPETAHPEADDDMAAQLQKAQESAPKTAAPENTPAAGAAQAAGSGTIAIRTENTSRAAADTLPAQSTADLAPAAAVSGGGQAATGGDADNAAGRGGQDQSQTNQAQQQQPDLGRVALAAAQPVQTIAEPPSSSAAATQTQTVQALSPAQGTTMAGLAAANGRLGTAAATTTLATAARMNPVDQIRVQIGKSLAGGMDSIHVRLHPESMGQVDIKLEMKGGQVTAAVTADKPETLQLLKNDAASLQQALKDAGLDADSSSLSFHLRGEQQDARTARGDSGEAALPDDEPSEPIEAAIEALTSGIADGLDIRV
ncbi:MAG: flagellar hook-length control protein FliK [Rhodospirillaceae bacterium]|nr:flagellar hook-length control protein FliK [Rhodospirillaceae bacterium]